MRPVALPIDLVRGCAQSVEDALDEGERHLAFPGKHGVGAGTGERWKVAQVKRAREDPDCRIALPGASNDLGAALQAGGADDEAARLCRPGPPPGRRREASPWTASIPSARSSRIVSMFISTTVGAISLSRSNLATARPIGP